MYSPFYIAEQKKLYPHRKDCHSALDVCEHIKTLVRVNAITIDEIKETAFGDLKYSFFLNADCFQISDGIKLYESQTETNHN